jgi:hypothetical protein
MGEGKTVGRIGARWRASAAVVSLVVLAGILGSPGGTASAGHDESAYFDLGDLPETDYTGVQIFDGLEQFVNDFPYRLTGSPNEIRAGMYLRDQMRTLGYDTDVCALPNSTNVICDSESGVGDSWLGPGLKAVIATKRGTTRPNEWIMFIGHYDSVPQTIWGAYDNGAGTNFIRYLAHEFADVPTNRSLVFVWYNGEEQGLLASARHAQYLKNRNQQISAVLGFDMVGIAFPVAQPALRNCMCMFHGADDGGVARPLLEFVNYDFLQFPGRGIPLSRDARYVGNNTRNSDERSFNDQGFFTLRWAGMRNAADYEAYHEDDDTIQKIIDEAGGATYYEQGIENTLKSVYYTTLALDNHPPVPDATIASSGLGIAADASASSDPDGAPELFAWDFGDGTTAEGVNVQHAYAAPGTYQVELTVHDNLWPQVTRTKTFTVNVS